MKLEEMTMTALVDLHNAIADHPAGPRTFRSKGDLITRLRRLAKEKGVNLKALANPKEKDAAQVTGTADPVVPEVKVQEVESGEKPPSRRGLGVGALARRLILEHRHMTYGEIAEAVNEAIPGAKATAKSVKWYGHKMRKEGVEGTERART